MARKVQYMEDELKALYDTIVNAIKRGEMDLALIEGEEYQHNDFIRAVNECWGLFHPQHPVCHIDRRRTICNLYADYCDHYCDPFVKGEERKALFLKAINNHFIDINYEKNR